MPILNSDLRKEFLTYLNQPESCELFYMYMKSEQLEYVLEFYLACDGLKNLINDKKTQSSIITLIYKYYLSNRKSLSSSKIFSLPDYLLSSIKQRLIKHEYHVRFYEQAQEYVLKYMLQILSEVSTFVRIQIEQKSRTTDHSENWNEYSDDESDFEGENTSDEFDVNTENSSDDEIEQLPINSSGNTSQFKVVRIFNEIPNSQMISYFRIKLNESDKFMHKQIACWLLTDNKPTFSVDRLQRVQQAR
ncbi:unnamed protein product [Rotaria sp. Silwood2]|nr:unnamed protein product [Rotaria sp. Silwood2]